MPPGVANAVIFDLNDALAVTGEARTERPRFRLLEAARQTLQRLAESDPSNAGWQRDLVVSHWRMADMAEQTGQGDAPAWWRKAYERLAGMKRRGMMRSKEEKCLAMLKQEAGG